MGVVLITFDINSTNGDNRRKISDLLYFEISEAQHVLKPTHNFYLLMTNFSAAQIKEKISPYINEALDTVFILNIHNPSADYEYYGVKSHEPNALELTSCFLSGRY